MHSQGWDNRLRLFVRGPFHPFHVFWAATVCSISLFFLVEAVFVACFREVRQTIRDQARLVYTLLAIPLILDIGVNFFKGVVVNGRVVMDPEMIARKYLRYKLPLDTVSTIALLVSIHMDSPKAVYLRLFMLVRFYDLYAFESVLFRLTMPYRYLREGFILAKIMLLELIAIHICGCLFFLLSNTLIEESYYGPAESHYQFYWLTNNQAYSSIRSLPVGQQYMWSFYAGASAMSTIVIGDIVGHNPIQVGFMYVMILVGTISAAYAFEEVVLAWSTGYRKVKEYLTKLNVIGSYMRRSEISGELGFRVQSFLQYKWMDEDQGYSGQQNQILTKLPKMMRNDMMYSRFQDHFSKIEALHKFPKEFLCKLLQRSVQTYFFQGSTIVNPFGTNPQCNMTLICSGDVSQSYQYDQHSNVIPSGQVRDRKIVGLKPFLTEFHHRKATTAATAVRALTVGRSDLTELAKDNPSIYELLCQTKHSVLYCENYKALNQECQACGQFTHSALDCQECHLKKTPSSQDSKVENDRQSFKRAGKTRTRKMSSSFRITWMRPVEQVQREARQAQIEAYAVKTWKRMASISKKLQDNYQTQPAEEKDYEQFQCLKVYEHYNPQHNANCLTL